MNIRTRLMFLVLLATLLPAVLIGLRFIQDRNENIEMAKQHLAAACQQSRVEDSQQHTGYRRNCIMAWRAPRTSTQPTGWPALPFCPMSGKPIRNTPAY